jgi:hypothetical protein
MTQPKRKKDEKAELVKLIQSVIPGDFVKVLENSIQRIVEEEVSIGTWSRSISAFRSQN